MLPIRVTIQVTGRPEIDVFTDEVSSERLCPTLSIAENSLRGALAALQTGGLIRQYIGKQMVKCVKVGRISQDATPAVLNGVTSKTGSMLGRLRADLARARFFSAARPKTRIRNTQSKLSLQVP